MTISERTCTSDPGKLDSGTSRFELETPILIGEQND